MRWMESTAEIFVEKPIEEVFDFAADLKNWETWVAGVSSVRQTSKGKYGVGSKLKSDYEYGGKTQRITYEVTEFSRPSVHAVKSTSGPYPFEGKITFAVEDGGTIVTNSIRAGSDSKIVSFLWGISGPFIRWMMRRQLMRELEKLKAELEWEDDE